MDRGFKVHRKINPKETAGYFSLVFFAYIFKVYRKGVKRDLRENDMYSSMTTYKSKRLGDRLEKFWEKEKAENKDPTIVRALLRCYGKRYFYLTLIQIVNKSFFAFMDPYIFSKFVSYFSARENKMTQEEAYIFGILIVVLNMVQSIIAHHLLLYKTEFGIQIQLSIASLIYRKALNLNTSEFGKVSTGNIVTILAKDIFSFHYSIHFISDIIVELLQMCMLFYLVFVKIGITSLTGFGIIVGSIPIQLIIASCIYKKRSTTNRRTDIRLQLTTEILAAIRVVKMYVWEKFMVEKLTTARQRELVKLRTIYFLKAISFCIGIISIKLGFLTMLLTYIWLGNIWTAELLFYVINCFGKVRVTITIYIPMGVHTLSELYASLKRINRVLNAKEVILPIRDAPATICKVPKVDFIDADVNINKNQILTKVNVKLKRGLNVVMGEVGSGKTSLLKTILEEYNLSNGKFNVVGTISYASQNPWLFPSSLKQNILFGQPYNEFRYKSVLRACALTLDVDSFINGDETILSDCGVNLSKGQQARVNLARALYKNSDIYLLDDSLSALDNHVKGFVFAECFKSFLKDKLCIFVTHDRKVLVEADNVVCMSKGTVVFSGKPTDIPSEIITSIEDSNKKVILSKEDIEEEHKDIDSCAEEEEKELIERTATSENANIYHEAKKEGSVGARVYKKYIKSGGGYSFFALLIFATMLAEGTSSMGDKIMSRWINNEEKMFPYLTKNKTTDTEFEQLLETRNWYNYVFSGFLLASVLLFMLRYVIFLIFAITASKKIHKSMITNIFGSVVTFFDTHMIGNIINRFAKDLFVLDEYIPFIVNECIKMSSLLLAMIAVVASVNTIYCLFFITLAIVFIIICKFALPTGRSFRRLDAAARSPIIGHLNATLEGLVTIRAYNTQSILKDEFDKHQDYFCGVNHIMEICNTGMGLVLHMISEILLSAIILSFLIGDKSTLAGGDVGLALSQALHISMFLEWGIRQCVNMESQMTSMERVLEYTDVKQESSTGYTIKNWPEKGEIKFENVNLAYRNNEPVLKNLNFTIKPNEKIGIVGRTGAGKSSIIVTLFRLYEVEGRILIDGVDIKTLSLEFLRTHVSIIPQDPVLFTGTIRSNLDPLGKYTDEKIWKALGLVHLEKTIVSLEESIDNISSKFSIGQKQLISLARAILRKSKIIILDEATANMDADMDHFIQTKIEECFANCTTVTVAHRLHTVMKCNKIMVMDQGEIVEFEDPDLLMKDKNSKFYKMVQSGE